MNSIDRVRSLADQARRLGDPHRWGPLHEPRTAAILGMALGVSFTVCFGTGVLSHLAQNEPSWFDWPARPAGLYRVTQGLHVTTGMASIPLLLAKLWVVYPRFVEWPLARSVLHAVERVALLPLVGGGLFLLISGTANTARWYPWGFFFPRAHYWAAWITIGALVVHIGAKAATTLSVFGRTTRGDLQPEPTRAEPTPPEPAHAEFARDEFARDEFARDEFARASSLERRAFLAGVGAAAGAVVIATAGGTVSALGWLSALAQRRPGTGPQGLPVNKAASQARVVAAASDPNFRLTIEGAVRRRLALSLDELRAMPQHEAELPIACVEGWSASARWRGVRVRDLLALAGAGVDSEVRVESLQRRGKYRRSELNSGQTGDVDTLLALEVNGEPLHLDHGFPVRLIGPGRPGVLQTKWVSRLVVR